MTASRGLLDDRTRFRRLLSFSGVDQFSNCERRYYFERILQRRQPDTPITLVGRTYHEAIAAMLTTRLPRTDEWVSLVVGEAIKRNHDALTKHGVACGSLAPEMESNLRRLREEVLAPCAIHTVADVVPFGRKRSWWIERPFTSPDVGYKGVIDLLAVNTPCADSTGLVVAHKPGRPCVFDWKSVTSDRRRSERDARTSAQLALYAIAANVTAACFVEIPRNLEKRLKTRVVEYTEQDLRDWSQWLIAMRDAVLSRGKLKERFRPADRKNPLCDTQWCPWYLSECYPSENTLTPTEEAVTL